MSDAVLAPVCAALAVLAAGVAVRPSPPARRGTEPAPTARDWRHAVAVFGLLRWVRRWRPLGAGRVTVGGVAEWCDQLARSMRSGDTMHAAAATPARDTAVATATAPLRHDLSRGRDLSTAADALSGQQPLRQRGPAALRLALSVVAAAARVGAPSAAPIDRVGAALRQRAADDQERTAQSAQAEMSARVLTALPIVTLLLLGAVDADIRHVVTAPHGALLVALGLMLNAAGWRWMRRIVRRSK
ncbi:MAG: hypothetical protein AAFY28_06595 [Actinomycetota bacterium]